MPTLILVSLSSAQHNKLSMSMKMSTKKEENNCFLLSLTLKHTEIVCLSQAMMRKIFTTRWMERSLMYLCQSALGRTWLLSKSNKTNRCRTPTTTIKKWLQPLEFRKQLFHLVKKVRKLLCWRNLSKMASQSKESTAKNTESIGSQLKSLRKYGQTDRRYARTSLTRSTRRLHSTWPRT